MNVLIMEIYENETGSCWICNYESTSQKVKDAIDAALADESNAVDMGDDHYGYGGPGRMELPCTVDKQVEIYFN